jgi:O-antigen ligase
MKNIIQNIKIELPPILFLLTLFVPLFGSPDRAITQWIYISLVNIFLLVYLNYTKTHLREVYKQTIFKIYLFYVFASLLSIIPAENKSESIVEILKIINLFLGFTFLSIYFSNSDKRKVLLISVILVFLLQNLKVFSVVFALFDFTSISMDIANRLTGYTMNKNISAYFILINLPVMVFALLSRKKLFVKLLLAGIICLGTINILIYGTRSAFISLIILIICMIAYHLIRSKLQLKNIVILSTTLIFSVFYVKSNNLGEDLINRIETLNVDDTSINKRVSYYKGAFDTMLENPILGIGLGNWKIYSVYKVKSSIKNYIAPYHVHNDFLQKGAEGGIISFISYILLIFVPLYIVFKKFLKNKNDFYFTLFLSLITYILDSLFNFPYSRPIMQINLMIILSLIVSISHSEKENK